jgi:hypothetical protein
MRWEFIDGGWKATDGTFAPSAKTDGQGMYTTFASLPYDLTDFTVETDIQNVSDGGLMLRSDAQMTNGVALAIGGMGYGTGSPGKDAGRCLYWHVVVDGKYLPLKGMAAGVVAPERPCHIKVVVSGSHYAAYLNDALRPATELDDSTYAHGRVALRDIVGASNISATRWSNFKLSGMAIDAEKGAAVGGSTPGSAARPAAARSVKTTSAPRAR